MSNNQSTEIKSKIEFVDNQIKYEYRHNDNKWTDVKNNKNVQLLIELGFSVRRKRA